MSVTNCSLHRVSEGMIRVVEAIDQRPVTEKQAIIAAVFNCMYTNKLKETYGLADIMDMVENMRYEAKRTKIPEFGGAERYIIGEL